MTLLMVVATLYGTAQALLLSSPTRTAAARTVVLAVVAGVFVCGPLVAVLEVAYTRCAAGVTGTSLVRVVAEAGRTVDPVIEELVKVTPLLLAACHRTIRRQWGLTDYVVTGAGLGAGFGLLEAMARYSLDADRVIGHRDGGWIVPDSLRAPYVPGPRQVFTEWFPAPVGSLELGGALPATWISPHLAWTALAALGAGILVRGRRWVRPLGALPVLAACALHVIGNRAGSRPADDTLRSLNETIDGLLWLAPAGALAIAVAADWWLIRRGKAREPRVLLAVERAGGTGFRALGSYALWRLPWTALLALRFARLRRAFLYAGAAARPADEDVLHVLRETVARAAWRLDASDRPAAWRGLPVRAVLRHARTSPGGRRPWWGSRLLLLVPLLLALPSVVFLVVGSFPSTAGVQEDFGSDAGQRVLLGFGLAGLLWTAVTLVLLLRARAVTRDLPVGDAQAALRFRIGIAAGTLLGGLALVQRWQGGVAPGDRVFRTLHLLEALESFALYFGFALLLLSLLALPAGGGLAFAVAGSAGGRALLGVPAVVRAAALTSSLIVLAEAAAANAGGEDGGAPATSGHPPPSPFYTNRYQGGRWDGASAELTRDGVLHPVIQRAPGTPRGSEMFDDMMRFYGPGDVRAIQGDWSPGMPGNLDTFNRLIREGHSPEDAAARTFTGKMAARYGFTEITDLVTMGPPGDHTSVRLLFRRP